MCVCVLLLLYVFDMFVGWWLRLEITSNLILQMEGPELRYNNNVVFISEEFWHDYYYKHYLPQSVQVFNRAPPGVVFPQNEYFWNPLQCQIQGAPKWKHCKVRQIHACVLSFVAEFVDTKNLFKWTQLCMGSLTDISDQRHKRLDHLESAANVFTSTKESVIADVRANRVMLRARSFGNISVSRQCSDDCTVTPGDFVWVWKRFGSNPNQKVHCAVKIDTVKSIRSTVA